MEKSLSGLNRRTVLSGIVLAVAIAQVGHGWAADAWPSKTVRIIVPFAPGGGADSSARVLAEVLAPGLGQSVIVENKPGAGSAIGVMTAAQSKDGHTLLMGSNSMVINPVLNPAITYDVARDFDAVGMVSAQPLVLVVPTSSKITSYAELVAEAKAKPGTMTAGNSGNGTLAHLTAELFALETKTSVTSVPYKGESALLPDLVGGLVACGFLNLPSVITHIKSGRLRALAVSSPTPVAELPNVPTLRSLGQPSLEVQGWAAMVAPKGTIPKDGLARLESLLAQALATDTVKKRFAAGGLEPVVRGRDATAQLLKEEATRWQQVIKARGIKAD
ncbi:MAG: tripartite tricarboxylate transporter substrate binding protein [Variovorax sp.]|nr:MAG: tripartite tricarboxylate transporter substrate binding protein [Variovorax sp.]